MSRTSFHRISSCLGLSLLLMSCAGGQQDAGADVVEKEMKKRGIEPASKQAAADACEVLNADMLRATLPVGEAEIELRPSKYSPHPLCTASWPRPNADELHKQQQAAMQEYIKAKARGEDVKIPIVKTSQEVSLTILDRNFDDQAAANAAFDSMLEMMQKGITSEVEVQGKKHSATFQASYEPVEGVADRAAWSDKLHQLSVLDGLTIFHVTVSSGEGRDTDLAQARLLAEKLTEQL